MNTLPTGFIVDGARLAWPALFFKKFYMVISGDFNLCKARICPSAGCSDIML